MERAALVESDAAMMRQGLKDVGFDDKQARVLVALSGTAAERHELKADVAVLKTDVAVLKTDIAELKTDVAGLKHGLANFRTETRGEFARLDARIDGLRDEMNARFSGLRDELNARFAAVDARFDGLEGRMKLMLWFMGVGLTLYTGTTISLMILLYRGVLA